MAGTRAARGGSYTSGGSHKKIAITHTSVNVRVTAHAASTRGCTIVRTVFCSSLSPFSKTVLRGATRQSQVLGCSHYFGSCVRLSCESLPMGVLQLALRLSPYDSHPSRSTKRYAFILECIIIATDVGHPFTDDLLAGDGPVSVGTPTMILAQ